MKKETLDDFLRFYIPAALALSLLLFMLAQIYLRLYIDEVEHIHSSWLITQGLVPYRDFFQHHHPLLWYLLLPLVKFINSDVTLHLAGRWLMFAGSCCTLFFTKKIAELFIKQKVIVRTALLFTLANPVFILKSDIRPDVFMTAFFYAGLYNTLLYLADFQRKHLTRAFFLFAIAFLFLQKVLIPCFAVGLVLLYFLFSKKALWKDVFIAFIPAGILLLLFFTYFIFNGAWNAYFQLNWTLNLLWPRSKDMDLLSFLAIAYFSFAIISSLFMIKKETVSGKITAFLFLAIFTLIQITCTEYLQYYLYVIPLSAICAAQGMFYNKYAKITGILWLNLMIFTIIEAALNPNFSLAGEKSHDLLRAIEKQTAHDDVIFCGSSNFCNMRHKDIDYYWFSLHRGAIHAQKYISRPYPDLEKAIKTKMPKIIYYKEPLFDVDKLIYEDKTEYLRRLDKDWLKKYYEPLGFEDFWVRKK